MISNNHKLPAFFMSALFAPSVGAEETFGRQRLKVSRFLT